jgi:tape measure domain-containing protein
MFGNNELSIVIRARDEASKVFSGVERNALGLHRRLDAAAGASRAFALGVGAGAVAIGGLGYAALKAANDMEQTRIAFETMLGSASKADEFVKQLVSFAKTTPFELQGLQTAAKQLLAYGFAQEEVIPNLRALGDIAAGVGMDKLPNLILAFGQVKAATKLTGMELRQFTEAGVPLLAMLSEQLGQPVAAIQKMVSEGEIGFPMVEEALKRLTSEGGRFNDLMAKQSKTLGGMLSNLSDAWHIFLAGEGEKLLDWAKKFTEAAIYIVENVLPVWVNRIAALVDWLGKHKSVLYIVAGAIIGALVPAIYAAVVAFGALAIALAPFIIGGAIVGGIVAGVAWIIEHWDMLKQKALAIWGAIEDKIRKVVEFFAKAKAIVERPIQFVADVAAKAGFGAQQSTFKSLPSFDKGGIVPGPVGAPMHAIVHGGERVIPVSGSRSADTPLILNFNFNDAVAGDAGIIQVIRGAVEELNRQAALSGIAGR